ncbi:MAG: hypothetical protein J6R35_00040, partial [Clostridia bacterium]|nr:hypothetical protein [Clostridia bacterium]
YLLTYDSTKKSLGASINLYNTSLLAENNVKLLSEFQTEGSYVNRGWYIFYNSDRISEVAFTPSASTDTAPAASVTLNGSGSKEDPYKINTPSDFLALGSLESGYAMLTAPITLGLTIYDYYVDSLKVNLDGNGYAIDGLSKPLFNSVSRDVLISNLTVIGDSEYYIALANNGTLNAVNVYGNGGYSVKTNADFGIISRASVNIIAGGVAEQSLGKVEFTRNLGGGAFFANESDGQVVSSYQYGSWNATNLVNSVRFTNDEYVVSEGALEDLIDYKAYSAIETIKKGWQFAQELGWGFVGNVENDIPTLVFPEDNLSYKLVTRVKNPYASVTESFGTNSASISRTMRTLLDYTYNANPELYPVMDEENDLYYDFDNIYQLVPSTITPFSRNDVECAIKHSFSNAVRTKLNEDAIFSWTYRKAGETEFKPIGSLVDFALVDGALTEYKFSFSVPYAYASGTFSVYESYGVLEINYMSSAYGKVDLINKLGLNNLQNSLIDLGYTQIDPLDPLGFDGVKVSITDAGGNAIGLNYLVYTVGRYTINVTIEPTASTTGYNFKSTFEITKGNLDLSGYEITSFVGGLTQSTALTYNAGNIINLNNNFRLKDYPYSNYSILVDIVYLSRSDYSVVYPTEVQDAGTYKLSLTIRVSGYDDYVREVYFYVNRQLVTVSTAVSDEVIEFYDAHPDVIYISALGSQAGLDDKLSYSSDYFIGADANATYTVTVNVANANSIYNYEVRAGSSATFRVVPANLDVSNVGFETKSVTYNGQSHSISVDTAKIGVKQFDTTPYEYTITYKYGDLISNEPFGFVDAGNYAIYAIITSSSSNYNVAQTEVVNLKINGLRLTLTAKDAYVNFGDDPVYDLTAVATDPAEEIAEDYVANLGLGEAIYITSSYVKGVTAGGSVLENDVVFKRVDGTEIIGSKVGNYIISVTVNGTLTIGKRTYALDMVTSYSYTGKAVKLDFKGETFNYSATYKRHNLIEDTYSDLGADVPISACAPNYEYIVVLNIAETNEYYGVNDYPIAFTINPIDITISGLYVTNISSKTPLTADMEVPYNGKDYVINIDSAELPYGVSFVWEFRYKLYNNTTEEYDYVSSNAIRLKDVTKIKDVELTLKTSVGNYNYNGYESAEFLEVTRFEIVPKEVKFTAPEALIYQGEAFSNEQIKAIVNALDYQAGYEVVEGDVFNYSVSFDEMLLPGDYDVIVASQNANYYVSESIAVSMTHATTTLNFNDIGVLEFYYGEVKKVGGERYPKFTRKTAYSIGLYNGVDNIDFRVDCAEYQLFLVPDDDLYDVISVDPLYKDGIKCVEFNLTGGLSKIKIKPLEVTFDWAKVKSETEGFKAEYEYTGEVISFYASFNRAMVKSVVEGLSVVTDPAIRITLSGSKPFKHVGEYTFTAESRYVSIDDDFQETSCFVVADSVKSFVTAIVPKTIVYEVEQKTIYIGDNFPLIFDVTYPQDDKSPHANDVLSYDYVAPGFTSNAPGSFSVTVTAQVVDGGQSY